MEKFITLLRDYGYGWRGNTLVRRGMWGRVSEHIVGRFRDPMEAAEYICPIVHDPEYTKRLTRLSRPTE